jgi:hypothetical protein
MTDDLAFSGKAQQPQLPSFNSQIYLSATGLPACDIIGKATMERLFNWYVYMYAACISM